MFNMVYVELKNWLFGDKVDSVDEFELIESKHTRVHHDENIREIIRVH